MSAWLSTDELAAELGWSATALRGWRHQGLGPAWERPGHAVRYSREAVDEWLRSSAVRSWQGRPAPSRATYQTAPPTPYLNRREQTWRTGGNDRERPPHNWVRQDDGSYRSAASGRIVRDPGFIARIERRQAIAAIDAAAGVAS